MSIIIDFGTALTFSVLDYARGIEGVSIAPGISTALDSLSDQTAQLPHVDLSLPDSVIGRDTQHAIQSGVLYGYIGLVTEIIQRMRSEMQGDWYVIATGGLCSVLPLDHIVDIYDKNLTLEGIRLIHQQHPD